MRALICCAVLIAICACTSFAADIPPETTSEPAQLGDTQAVTAPPPSEEVTPIPYVPTPVMSLPCPVMPSEPPSGMPTITPPRPILERPGDFVEFNADELRTTYENGVPAVTTAKGHVTTRFRDYLITSQSARVDYRTNIAIFEGDVVFRVGIQEAHGESIQLNIKTGAWESTTARSTLLPQFLGGYLLAPVFTNAGIIDGIRDRKFDAQNLEATTCNLEHPHYEIIARSMDVYPNEKIIFRHVSFYALGRRLFTIPRFIVPIRQIQRYPNVVPRVGQSLEEGAYVKTNYTYLGTATQTGTLLLDLMTRKGVGTGIRHIYNPTNVNGDLTLYHVYDNTINKDTLWGSFNHTQRLSDSLITSFSSDFRSNSYLYAPQSTTLINRFAFTRNRPTATSSLVINQDISDVSIETTNLAGNLRHHQTFGTDAFFDSNIDYVEHTTSNNSNSRLTSKALYTKNGDKFDWSVAAEDITDLTDEGFIGGGRFAGIERLPEVSLYSDSARLGSFLPLKTPAKMRLTFGQYNELPANTDLGRALFDLAVPNQLKSLSSTWSLQASGGFRQFFYSDNTAQYSISANTELKKKIGEKSSFGLTYRYQQPRGYTPFRFDYIGRYNTVNGALNLQETQQFRMSLITGYNFAQNSFPWQDVVFRSSYEPNNSLLLYTATSYDPNKSQWRTLINQLRIRAAEDFKLDLGTRYDPVRGQLASIRSQLDWQASKKWRFQALAGYNGFTNSFDYRSLKITRDLHCWEASLTFVDQNGFYTDRGIYFNLRIKAFPVFDSFGVGPYGAALDTSVGQVY